MSFNIFYALFLASCTFSNEFIVLFNTFPELLGFAMSPKWTFRDGVGGSLFSQFPKHQLRDPGIIAGTDPKDLGFSSV